MHVLRWGQSAYETDADLALEREAARAVGFTWGCHPDPHTQPVLDCGLLVVTSKVKVTARVLSKVRRVLTTTSGYDHIDLEAAAKLGVQVARSPLARRDAVVEHALGALIGLMKRWPTQLERARMGTWCRAELPALAPRALRGSRILLVGQGVIGRQMSSVLTVLGAEVLAIDPRGVPDGVTPATLEDLPSVDAVSLHCSLTATSSHLLSAQALSRLPKHAVVVNTARGRSLDVGAAVEAVQLGRLRGLAVDVFPVEPYPQLAAHSGPAIWFTPHGAGYAPDLGRRVANEVASAVQALAEGRSLPSPVELSSPG